MRKRAQKLLIILVLLVGTSPFLMATFPSLTPTLICYRGRTTYVPAYMVPIYVAAGATPGACTVSGP